MKWKFLLLVGLLFIGCADDFRTAEPKANENFEFNGSFKIFDEPFLRIDDITYENWENAPFKIIVEQLPDNLVFRFEFGRINVLDLDVFINVLDCLKYNSTEILILEKDVNSNDVVVLIYNIDFKNKCYLIDDLEKEVSFVLKSQKSIF